MPQNCPYCREVLAETNLHPCPTCGTPHHLDCWQENSGCTVFGCQSAPSDDPKIAVTAPDLRATPRLGEAASYFVARGQQQNGPYTLEQVREQLRSYQVNGSDLIWTEGMANWLTISEVVGTSVAQPVPHIVPTQLRAVPVVQQPVDPLDGRMHFGRGLWFLCYIAIIIAVAFLNAIDPGLGGIGMIGFLVIAVLRLRDIGYSGWIVLLMILPIVNIFFLFMIVAAPRAYEITKKSDTAMKVIGWSLLGLFVLAILAAVIS